MKIHYDCRQTRLRGAVSLAYAVSIMSANRNSVEWMCASNIGCGSLLRSHTYAYDGWNLILEQIAHAGGATDVIEYFWGSDLSGSEQGAGGVGGLVALAINGDFYFPCYDNNGNIIAYVDESGSIAAQFAYDAFGNLLATDNSQLATLLSFRFSTKYLDPETGFYYYGYRYYDPDLGRWLTRDPLEEQGGLNLYGFCGNDAVNRYDVLGMFQLENNWQFLLTHYVSLPGEEAKRLLLLTLLELQNRTIDNSDPWLMPFLVTYFYYSGRVDIVLTESDVKKIEANGNRPLELNFRGVQEGGPQFFKTPRVVNVTTYGLPFRVSNTRYGNLTLGDFNVEYRGRVDTKCTFKGEYRVKEEYFDMNWRDYGERSIIGESLLRVFSLTMYGTRFKVYSDWIKVEQNIKDGHAK